MLSNRKGQCWSFNQYTLRFIQIVIGNKADNLAKIVSKSGLFPSLFGLPGK